MKKMMIVLLMLLTLTLNVLGFSTTHNPDALPKISIESVRDDAIILESNDDYTIIEQDDDIYLVVN